MDDLVEKMVRATDEAMKPVDAAIVIASIHGHCLPDGEPPMYAAMRAALHAISARGEWAVVPVEPTEEMCAKGVLQAERVLRIKDVQLVEMEYVYKAMTQARPKVAG